MKRKDSLFYFFIVSYGLLFVLLLMGNNYVFGSKVDWFSQHTVISDYFRKIFYETGSFIPNFVFNLGSGQNIYNFSYYGLLSPIILISYFFPFLEMDIYVMIASVILYILSGIVCFKFLKCNKFSRNKCFFGSLILLTLSPITFHFHRHIMFVWYIPFLLLAFMGVDRYLKKFKSDLLMISIFLIIMTNYYYGFCSIITILVYGIYKMLEFKQFCFSNILKASIRVIIPIVMASIILLPTIYVILNGSRGGMSSVSLLNLFLPDFSEVFYDPYSMGLIGLFLISAIGIMSTKKKNIANMYLGISLLIFSMVPIFMYVMNGFLYVRGKVLIPFCVLYIYSFLKFIDYLVSSRINIKRFFLSTLLFVVLILMLNYENLFYCIDVLLCLAIVYVYFKYKNIKVFCSSIFLLLFIITVSINNQEKYVDKEYYDKEKNIALYNLYGTTQDGGFYRSSDKVVKDGVNRVYSSNYNSTSIYSSIYNSYYWDFYNKEVGNNIKYRNLFMTNGTNNCLFDTFMGVKYITAKNNPGCGYKKIDEDGDINLYYSDDSFPVIYTTDKVGGLSFYEKLQFPYNLEYLLNVSVVSDGNNYSYDSKISEYKFDILDSYDFEVDENLSYKKKIDSSLKSKLLFISFDMKYNESCKNGDTSISINGVKNTLTCKSWIYHNENRSFEYVVPIGEDTGDIVIDISKGKYKIDNIKTFVMDYSVPSFDDVDNLKINKTKSIISFSSDMKDNGYLITSIPYDRGFDVFVDGKKVSKEIVNTSFLGFKLDSGKHEVLIKYSSPLYKEGVVFSCIGIVLFIIFVGCEMIFVKSKRIKY